MDKIEILHELCESLMREMEECNEKIRMAGGKLTSGDVDYLDKLTHALKSIKTTIAMMESDGGYSTYMPRYYGEGGRGSGGGQSNRGGQGGGQSYRQGGGSNSYARGRGRNARRDSMGRYSRMDGYSYDDGMEDILSEIRDMMGELPDEKRRKVERLVNELES